MRVAIAVAVLSLSGCAVLDARGRFAVEPPDLAGCRAVRFRVVAGGGVTRARIEIDGRDRGSHPTNEDLELALDPTATDLAVHALTGPRRARLRVRTESGFAREIERAVVFDCRTAALERVEPPPGPVDGTIPLRVRATFGKALAPASVTRAAFTATGGHTAAFAPAKAELEPDGRTVLVDLGVALERVGPVAIEASLRDITGLSVRVNLGTFTVPTVQVFFDSPAEGSATNGVIAVAARAGAEPAGPSALLAGDQVVAALGPPPWSVALDTSVLPEGRYRLSIRSPGSLVVGTGPTIVVDRTPPRVSTCEPVSGEPADLPVDFAIRFGTDEPLVSGRPALLVDGSPVAFGGEGQGILTPIDKVTAPAAVEVVLDGGRDAAGNALQPFNCAFQVPYWRRLWGSGPITTASGPVLAAPAGFGADVTGPWWVGAAGTGEGGWLHAGTPTAGGLVDPGPRLGAGGVDELSVSANVSAWIEGGLGGRLVRARSRFGAAELAPNPLNAAADLDARRVAADDRYVDCWAVAWSERAPSGGRRIAGLIAERGGFPLAPAPIDDLRLDPAAEADWPAIRCDGSGATVVWLETVPGGVSQLRAARRPGLAFPGPWTAEAFPIQSDPAAPAAEPSFVAGADETAFTWRQGDTVLVRTWQFRQGWLEPALLNASPTGRARSPQATISAFRVLVCFVEEGAGGDEIWCRTWNGSAWDLLPRIANEGVLGPVLELRAGDGGLLSWRDALGQIWVRQLNR